MLCYSNQNFVINFWNFLQYVISKNGRGGQRPLGVSPRIHPFLRMQASLSKEACKAGDAISRISFDGLSSCNPSSNERLGQLQSLYRASAKGWKYSFDKNQGPICCWWVQTNMNVNSEVLFLIPPLCNPLLPPSASPRHIVQLIMWWSLLSHCTALHKGLT